MKNKLFYFFLVLLIWGSCSKKETDTPNKGSIVVMTDASFRNVSEALVERYMAHYPETKIDLKVDKEDFAWVALLQKKARVIVMSRPLSPKEIKDYEERIDLPIQEAKFAADAVVFVVNKNSPLKVVSVAEIKNHLQGQSPTLIFDGVNASNFNFVTQKLQLDRKKINYQIIKGNENIIHHLQQFPEAIGVISLNTLSNPYSRKAKKLRDQIKILSVEENGAVFFPSLENLKTMKYPFTRVLYFLTNEGYFGLGNGLIRFACTQKGQIVVSKEGLQPYNIYKREVIMR